MNATATTTTQERFESAIVRMNAANVIIDKTPIAHNFIQRVSGELVWKNDMPLIEKYGDLVMAGEFHIECDNENDSETARDIFQSFGFNAVSEEECAVIIFE